MKYLFCNECSHGKEEHDEHGCHDFDSGIGPSDNTDVWEEPCDCGRYVPERGVSDYDEDELNGLIPW